MNLTTFIVLILFNQNVAFGSNGSADVVLSAISRAFTTPFEAHGPPEDETRNLLKPEVETKNGVVFGAALPEAHAFFSIPYAAAPIEDMRFLSPSPAKDYTNGEFDASLANGIACFQTPSDECEQGLCFNNLSEDCLVLNVYVPSRVSLLDRNVSPDDRLPILLWIHGGGMQTGSGTSPIYDGRYLSNVTNTIVVTINYRLGAFGFLVFEENGVVHRNQGLKDQQLAMKWVQENIEKFGGDKDRVTLMGNSAGAQSVMFHLMSSISEPLFKRAIIQSQPAIFQYPDIEHAQNITQQVLKNTDCESGGVSCLRNVTATSLAKQGNRLRASSIARGDLFAAVEPFGFVLDDEEFDQNPLQFVQSGHWQGNKQVIMGTNIDEMIYVPLYIPDRSVFNSKEGFEGVLNYAFGDTVGEMLAKEYEKRNNVSMLNYDVLLGQLVTDGFFICPVRQLARLSSVATNVYLYSYAYAMNDPSCDVAWKPKGVCGNVFHSAENSFVFRTGPLIPYNFSAEDILAVNQFSFYWGNFAYSGNPSQGNVTSLGELPEWPLYQSSEGPFEANEDGIVSQYSQSWLNYVIDSPTGHTDSDFHKDICDFWDSTGFYVTLDSIDATTSGGITTGSDDSSTMQQDQTVSTTLQTFTDTTSGGAKARYLYHVHNLCLAMAVAMLIDLTS